MPSRTEPRPRKPLILRPRDVAWLLRCLLIVAIMRIALSLLPYRRIGRWIPAPAGAPANDDDVYRVAWGVAAVAKLIPHASCLTQALAGQYLLAKAGHPATIQIGVAREKDGRVSAHAWLLHGDRIVLGGTSQKISSYTPLTDLGQGAR